MASQKKRFFAGLFNKLFEEQKVDYALTDSADAARLYRDTIDLRLLVSVGEPTREKCTPVVLDVGCGMGRVASILVSKGFRVVGVDVSKRALLIAKGGPRRSEGLILSDAENIPLRDDMIDVIVALYVTDYVGMDDFLGECKRVLQEDGRVVFTVPNAVGVGIRQRIMRFIYSLVMGKERKDGITNSHSRSDIFDVVHRNALKIKTICGHEFISPGDLKLMDRLLSAIGVPSRYLAAAIASVNSHISETWFGMTLSRSFAVVAESQVVEGAREC